MQTCEGQRQILYGNKKNLSTYARKLNKETTLLSKTRDSLYSCLTTSYSNY